jgi:hypothetical protein
VWLVRWAYIVEGTEAMHSYQSSSSPPLLSHYAGRVDVANMWG